jgi:hypothetical protein
VTNCAWESASLFSDSLCTVLAMVNATDAPAANATTDPPVENEECYDLGYLNACCATPDGGYQMLQCSSAAALQLTLAAAVVVLALA